jgi:hypothetical protein
MSMKRPLDSLPRRSVSSYPSSFPTPQRGVFFMYSFYQRIPFVRVQTESPKGYKLTFVPFFSKTKRVPPLEGLIHWLLPCSLVEGQACLRNPKVTEPRYAATTKLLRQRRNLCRRQKLRRHTGRGRSRRVVHTHGFSARAYNEDTGKQIMLFPRVHFKTSPSFSSAAGRFTHKSCNG